MVGKLPKIKRCKKSTGYNFQGVIIEAGETLDLVLSQTGSEPFKGFLVLAQDSIDNTKIGEFLIDSSE